MKPYPITRRSDRGAQCRHRVSFGSLNISTPVSRRSEDHNHFSAGFVLLHDAMSVTDFVEAEDSDWLDVEPTSRGVGGDLLKRHVREREARRTEDEAAEEGQMNAARHLQQRVEVADGIE